MADDGLERLRRWRDESRGVPPAVGRFGARLEEVAPAATAVRLPLTDELRLPDGSATAAVTSLVADFGLTTSVVASLPDLRGVTTICMTVDHLGPPPVSGALLTRCTATPYDDGRPQHATGTVHDDAGRQVASVTGWFLPATAPAHATDRVGLVDEPPAAHLLDLLRTTGGPSLSLHARDALSNALGTLHGAVGAAACHLAAVAAVEPGLRTLTSSFTYLRPTPRDGSVTVVGEVVRQGRRTSAAAARMTGPDGRAVLEAHVVLG